MKLSDLGLPRPTRWDFAALAVAVVAALAAAVNLWLASRKPPGTPFSGGLTAVFVTVQLLVAAAALAALGRTAKEGTFWGDLFAVLGIFASLSGVLLAAALWAAA